MIRVIKHYLLSLVATAVLVSASASAMAADASQRVKFASAPWPGVTVKTTVAQTILEAIGYDTNLMNASWTIALQGVARGNIDADLGIWMPTQKSTVEPLVQSGRIDLLVKNVPDARYDLVVPAYVWNAGVHSIADLQAHADKFDHRIYGIEAGNDGNEIVQKAIDANTYGLSDWRLRASSTAAMLAEAGRAIDKKQWIVFLGWKPHWMNIRYDLKYLEDPKQIWGGGSSVWTAINPAYAKANPNATRFLKQMVVPSKIQSQWIYAYGYKKQSADTVATTWIKNHWDTVGHWLDGVTTADGSGPALAAAKQAIGG
ncbi:ABC transporter substrate-binding protein [Salinisphaera sp. Q1T1-3]|uniref:ABC transporter substrate-binding protein n=1 Tax=Salinisphaera sp. Q1T1-3 TaxID=2321229 RepID=UPI001314685E|nr:ABC transporter substrate-binding protein [Salinisphaera sp. Q1T1-3]